nr:Ndr [Hymenolepis microstoma]
MTTQKPQKITVETKSCGPLTAYLHGGRVGKDVAVLTLHDLGCNFKEFYDFANHDHMIQLTQRIFWIHIEVPGQGDNEPDLPTDWKFPTMQKIAEGVAELCDSLELKHVVVIGDGAGANILARVAMLRSDICLGAILIHCTGTTAGFMESFRDRMNAWKLKSIGMNPSVENYLMLHRFGIEDPNFINATTEAELRTAISNFLQNLRENINPKNLHKFIQAFMVRTNITDSIGNMKCPVLFITGSVASFNHTVYTLYNALMQSLKDEPARKANVEILEIDGVANVMRERPEKVAESVQNFMQGLGIASGVVNRRLSSTGSVPRNRNRSASMDEYDQPIGVKNLIFDNSRRYSKATDIHGSISETGET